MANLDIRRINEHRKTIENNLRDLEARRGKSLEDFEQDKIGSAAVKYWLQTAIQAMIDISNHICARLRLEAATEEGSGKCIRALEKEGLLPQKRATTYVQMIRFRNVLVHLYGEVDEHRVHEIIEKELDYFRMFLVDIEDIIERQQKKEKNGKAKKSNSK